MSTLLLMKQSLILTFFFFFFGRLQRILADRNRKLIRCRQSKFFEHMRKNKLENLKFAENEHDMRNLVDAVIFQSKL